MKTVLYNGKIYVDKGHFEEALLQEDGVIVAVGKTTRSLPWQRTLSGMTVREKPCSPA